MWGSSLGVLCEDRGAIGFKGSGFPTVTVAATLIERIPVYRAVCQKH